MKSPRFRVPGAAFHRVTAALIMALIVLAGIGCGQRGPLYLPAPESDLQTASPAGPEEGDSEAQGADETAESEDSQ